MFSSKLLHNFLAFTSVVAFAVGSATFGEDEGALDTRVRKLGTKASRGPAQMTCSAVRSCFDGQSPSTAEALKVIRGSTLTDDQVALLMEDLIREYVTPKWEGKGQEWSNEAWDMSPGWEFKEDARDFLAVKAPGVEILDFTQHNSEGQPLNRRNRELDNKDENRSLQECRNVNFDFFRIVEHQGKICLVDNSIVASGSLLVLGNIATSYSYSIGRNTIIPILPLPVPIPGSFVSIDLEARLEGAFSSVRFCYVARSIVFFIPDQRACTDRFFFS
jgi:hypothetical protein